MKPEDMILVSVDDHVVEPPDMFEQHLPEKWKSKAPHVVKKKDGSDVWVFQGAQIPNIGLNAVAGRPPEEYGMEPTAFEQLRPGTWDVDARIGDMNANGVLAGMCFPSYPGFFGALFALCSILLGSVDTGWTFYTPYSTTTSTSVIAIVTGVFILGFS